VVSDIALPSIDDYLEGIGEASLENPLDFDTIPSVKFDKLNRVQPYLGDLEKHSRQRVAAARDFDYIREDIERVKKAEADKTISLNELKCLGERQENEARQKRRDLELKSRKPLDEKVYQITLKDVDLPGLPPPVGKSNTVAAAGVPVDNGRTNLTAHPEPLDQDKPQVTDSPAAHPILAADDASDDDDSDAAPDKPAPVDATLVETEHILMDYIADLTREPVLTSAPSPLAPSAIAEP
jgi:carboxyl-terminal processing protease